MVHREVQNRSDEGRTLGDIGFIYILQNRWQEAAQAYRQSLSICREVDNQVDEGMGLTALGRIYTMQGHGTKAEELLQQGLTVHREVANFVKTDMPLGRFGRPEEVSAMVAFLASERASLMTGTCVNVDGCQSRSNI